MDIIGIVAEYNPFHLGHEFHIRESRRLAGEDSCVLAVMSGDYVQRGEAAVLSKFARAEAACLCGADLVIELPLPWSVSSAETFADGAVSLLAAFHPDFISFGSETGDLRDLTEVAELLSDDSFRERLRQRIKASPDVGYAAVRQKAAEECLGRSIPALAQANNILAIEYLKSMRRRELKTQPITVIRHGARHDEQGNQGILSAASIRTRLRNGDSIDGSLPEEARKVLLREKNIGRINTDPAVYDRLIMSRLRMQTEESLRKLPDASNGLAERLLSALHKSRTLEETITLAAAKQFTTSRVRRACVSAALGISRNDSLGDPQYARILAFSRKGQQLLHDLRGETSVPVLTKPAQVKRLGVHAQHVFALGANAHDFFTLLYPKEDQRTCGEDWSFHPAFVDKIQIDT